MARLFNASKLRRGFLPPRRIKASKCCFRAQVRPRITTPVRCGVARAGDFDRHRRVQPRTRHRRSRYSTSITVIGANWDDSMALEPTLDALPAVHGLNGRPSKRSDKLHADRGNNGGRFKRYLKQHDITTRIGNKGIESKEQLRGHQWVSSARMPGLLVSASCTFSLSGGPIFIPRSFRLPLRPSVLDSVMTCVSDSNFPLFG